MTSLPDMRRLLQVSEHRQLQNELKLRKTRQALLPLDAELGAIHLHTQTLTQLLHSHQTAVGNFDHAQLLAWLKHQAVIRRQITDAELDRARVLEQQRAVTEQIAQFERRHQGLQKKGLLYAGLHQRLLGEYRAHQRRREEDEIEELLASIK